MSQGIPPRIRSMIMTLAALCGLAAAPLSAQAAATPAGNWQGQLEMPGGMTVDLSLSLDYTGGAWTGSITGTVEGEPSDNVQLSGVTYANGRVSFSFTPADMPFAMNYRASYLTSEDRLSGTITMAGQSQPLNFYRVAEKTKAGQAPGGTAEGAWVGRVKTSDGEKIDIKLNNGKADNKWAGTLEDPAIGLTTVMNMKVSSSRLSFSYKPTDAPFPLHFMGSYLADKDQITGTFSRHGSSRFVKFKRVPGTVAVHLAPGEKAKEPARIRHDYHFALTGRVNDWTPLHVTQDNTFGINDLTTATVNFDATAKWFVLDGFTLFGRYYRGGQSITDDPAKLAPFAAQNISGDSYLQLDGWEIGVMGYLGNLIVPKSRFNPYLTGAIGTSTWALFENGRGGTVARDGQNAFEGTDIATAFGMGTEYEINSHMALELEWLWRYFLTEDETVWTDTKSLWSNTHAWALSAGLTLGF